MRLIKALLALAFVALGVLFAALNHQPVLTDFGLFTVSASLGLSLVSALLLGVLLGGVVALIGSIWPRRRRSVETAMGPKRVPTSGTDG